MPSDLVYPTFADSSFSKAGAGPWGLTKAQLRPLGLKVNKFVDERRDPLKSTRAVAEYVAQLHDDIGDWCLAIVAFSIGKARLSRLVAEPGETST